ncbi:hypothetical protein [Streptomyces sp. NPDC001604]|uniref:hypothetical protein n=1 Tax=Streptomyces sp. NPDC001604 TaxID=3364593 RepID=UPI0036B0A30C
MNRSPLTPAPHSALSAAYARLNRTFPGPAALEAGVDEQVPTVSGRASAASLAEGGVDLDTFPAQDTTHALRDHGVCARPDAVASFGPRTAAVRAGTAGR